MTDSPHDVAAAIETLKKAAPALANAGVEDVAARIDSKVLAVLVFSMAQSSAMRCDPERPTRPWIDALAAVCDAWSGRGDVRAVTDSFGSLWGHLRSVAARIAEETDPDVVSQACFDFGQATTALGAVRRATLRRLKADPAATEGREPADEAGG